MRLCNFHADTPCRLFRERLPFSHPSLQAGAYAHLPFRSALEVYAFYSEPTLSDEDAWDAFLVRLSHFRRELAACPLPIPSYLLAVEDARLLAGDLTRLERLRDEGIRILTLTWGGESIIGGAHGTSLGLTPFGRQTVLACFSLGIIPDVSHGSHQLTEEVLALAEARGKPILASHSNFQSICPHSRNITDLVFLRIAALGGVTGISLCPQHLSPSESVGIEEVVRHIEHGMELCSGALVLGTDFDGISQTPIGLTCTAQLPRLAQALRDRGYARTAVENLFFGNGIRFLRRAMPDLDIDIKSF